MKTLIKKTKIERVDTASQLLTGADMAMQAKLEKAKKTVKEIEAHLKPRITATIEEYGVGRVMIDNTIQIELKRSVRNSVAWKPLCHSVASEEIIAEVQESFTEPYNVDSMKVL